jgi:predicted permease
MRERWLATWVGWCRRLAPHHLREEAFDPSVSDLVLASVPPLRFCLQVLLIALECRRLGATALAPAVQLSLTQRTLVTQQLRGVVRRLWREPRFAVAVVLTLALGLGANLTVFTFVDAFLIAPLPVPNPDALVRVGQDREDDVTITSYLNYRDGRDAARPVLDLAAHSETVALVGPPEAAEPRALELVSGNYFRVLGVAPQRGRLLSDADDSAELAHPVVVVSDRYWRSRLGGRPDVVGQSLILNGARFDIVGVAPSTFRGTYAARQIDLWAPVTMQQVARPRGLTLERRTWGWLFMIGRLTPGHTIADAERALAAAAEDITRRFPPSPGDGPFRFEVRPATALAEADRRRFEGPLVTTFAFTGLLFLATCANLAGLMHARLTARRRELAIRQSLGAGRTRLIAEWMTECLLLACAGGAAALVLARFTAIGLSRIDLPLEMMGSASFATTLQWRVVFYALGVSALGCVLFGVTSAWRASRQAPVDVLKSEGGAAAGGRQSARTRRVMVAFQVGVSVVLLLVASLLASSLHRQRVAPPGFAAADVGLMSIDLRRQRVPEGEWPVLTRRALDSVRTTAGVAHADIGFRAPLQPGEDQIVVRVPGYDPSHDAAGLSVDFNQVGPAYFDTLGIPFVAGHTWDDRAPTQAVVINKTMASRYWPDAKAVGKTVLIGRAPAIVSGVVADTLYYNVGESPRPYIYLPAHVQPPGSYVLHVRTTSYGDVQALVARVAQTLASADSRLAPFDVMSFDDLRQVPLFPIRMLTMAAVIFGGVSLLLTVVGVYGVIAASVSGRAREIGVRLALGAAPDRIQRGVIGEALVLAVAGGGVGLIAAYLTARELQAWLFEVQPFEPALSVAVMLLVAVIAALSAWMPARRASHVDPIIVLK